MSVVAPVGRPVMVDMRLFEYASTAEILCTSVDIYIDSLAEIPLLIRVVSANR